MARSDVQETERRWKVNDRVVVACASRYKGRVGTVNKTNGGELLVAFDDPPPAFGSPAWFASGEVEEAPRG